MTDREPRAAPDVAAPALALAGAIRALLESLPSAEPFLRGWPKLGQVRLPSIASGRAREAAGGLPVLSWLGQATLLGVPATARVLAALAAAADTLEWRQTYGAREVGPAFLDRYGWTELIGLRGPIRSLELACGILMLGPDTDYPPHAHEAEELYVPLAGSAQWVKDSGPYAPRNAGTPIHHLSWMPHGVRTGSEPLLALYAWRGGDLSAKSRFIRQG